MKTKPPYDFLAPLIISMIIFTLIILHTCQRFEPEGFLHVNNLEVVEVLIDEVRVSAEVEVEGEVDVHERGFCWSATGEPTISDNLKKEGEGQGMFTATITGLLSSTPYVLRAYATNSSGTTYSDSIWISTLAERYPPEVSTAEVSEITAVSARSGGTVISEGSSSVIARGVCWSTSENPSLKDSRTTDGEGVGSFPSAIRSLQCNTKYYVSAYAINHTDTAYGVPKSFSTAVDCGETVTDYDGNVYRTVQIGEQVWMAENLITTSYADGSSIPPVESNGSWNSMGVAGKGYCWYDNSTANRDAYGGLYSWAAVVNGTSGSSSNPSGIQGVCPDGWHVPSDAEWKQLEMYLGMDQATADQSNWRGTNEGAKLKEMGTMHWSSPNEASDLSGLTLLPGGYRSHTGAFSGVGVEASIWSATGKDDFSAWRRTLMHNREDIDRGYSNKLDGGTVRCVKNTESVIAPTLATTNTSNISTESAQSGGEITSEGGGTISDRGVCWSTTQNPDIHDDTIVVRTSTLSFTTIISGLSPGTTYYVRAFAINEAGPGYGQVQEFTTLVPTVVEDVEGNLYQTIDIGDQVWMAENLRTTKYPDGTDIEFMEDAATWFENRVDGKAYCWYGNDPTNKIVYGALYTASAALNGSLGSSANPSGIQGVCPDGWHLPSDAEWKQLEIHLGMSTDVDETGHRGPGIGNKLRSKGYTYWLYSGVEANNESGFSALPAGRRSPTGTFEYIKKGTNFWTATKYDSEYVWYRGLDYDASGVWRYYYRGWGLSIRCVQD